MAMNNVVVNGMWLLRLIAHLDKTEKKEQQKKRGKFWSLCPHIAYRKSVLNRFIEHLLQFKFKSEFLFCKKKSPDFENMYNLFNLNNETGRFCRGKGVLSAKEGTSFQFCHRSET